MARVRSKGTRLEARFRDIAGNAGLRIRRADSLAGKPDFRIVGTRSLIFVNSCYWHGCPRHCRMPTSRTEYWQPKIKGNIRRQAQVIRTLKAEGYRVLVVWEHAILRNRSRVLARLRAAGPTSGTPRSQGARHDSSAAR